MVELQSRLKSCEYAKHYSSNRYNKRVRATVNHDHGARDVLVMFYPQVPCFIFLAPCRANLIVFYMIPGAEGCNITLDAAAYIYAWRICSDDLSKQAS